MVVSWASRFSDVQRRPNSLESAGGYSTYREKKPSARDASLAGEFAQQWKLRMLAQGATLRGAADGKMRRLSAISRPPNFTDVEIGVSAFFLRRFFVDIDRTGSTVKLQSATFQVARYCAQKRAEEKDVREAEWSPASGTWDGAPWVGECKEACRFSLGGGQ